MDSKRIIRSILIAILYYILGRLGLPLVWHLFSIITVLLASFYAPLFFSRGGLEAFKRMVSSPGSVSPPLWLTLPEFERAEFLNSALFSLWPSIRAFIKDEMRQKRIKTSFFWPFYKSIEVTEVDIGSVPARIHGIRTLQRPNELLIDFEVTMDGALLKLRFKTPIFVCPLLLKNVSFSCRLRLVLDSKLSRDEAKLQFLKFPSINFDYFTTIFINNSFLPKLFTDIMVDLASFLDAFLSMITESLLKLNYRSNKTLLNFNSSTFGWARVKQLLKSQQILLPIIEMPWGVLNLTLIDCKNIANLGEKRNRNASYYAMVRVTSDCSTHVFTSLLSKEAEWNLAIELPIYNLENLGSATIELWQLSDNKSAQYLAETEFNDLKSVFKDVIDKNTKKNFNIKVANHVVCNAELGFGLLDDHFDSKGTKVGSEGLVVVVVHSCHLLPLSQKLIRPDVFVHVSLADQEQNTVVVEKCRDPVFQHRMTFLVRSINEDNAINLSVRDASTGDTLGSARVIVNNSSVLRPLYEVDLGLEGPMKRQVGFVKCSIQSAFIVNTNQKESLERKIENFDKNVDDFSDFEPKIENDDDKDLIEMTNEVANNMDATSEDVMTDLDQVQYNPAEKDRNEGNKEADEEEDNRTYDNNEVIKEDIKKKNTRSMTMMNISKVVEIESEESSLPESEQIRRRFPRRKNTRRSRSLPAKNSNQPRDFPRDFHENRPAILVSMSYSRKEQGLNIHLLKAQNLPLIKVSKQEAPIEPRVYVKLHLLESSGLSSVRLPRQKCRTEAKLQSESPCFDQKIFLAIPEADLASRRIEVTASHCGLNLASALFNQLLLRKSKAQLVNLVLGRTVIDLGSLAMGLKVANEVFMEATWFELRPDRNMSKFLVLKESSRSASRSSLI